MRWAVKIEGKYSALVVEYATYDEACAGAERARQKIAFSRSEIEVMER
jgi:hypothetical protein